MLILCVVTLIVSVMYNIKGCAFFCVFAFFFELCCLTIVHACVCVLCVCSDVSRLATICVTIICI